MKQTIATLLLLTNIRAANAQVPTITSASFFQVGKAYVYKYTLDSALWHIAPGNGGANVVWDYNAIDWANYFCIDTTIAILPATTAKFSTCGISGTDTADICLLNKSVHHARTEEYRYYNIASGKIAETGADQDNGTVEDINFFYSKPTLTCIMPYTYLSYANDSFTGSYFSYLSGPHFVKGTDSILADGFGLLKTDSTNYYNCVRVKHIRTKTDSNIILGVNTIKSITYTWYSTTKEAPVLVMEQNIEPAFKTEGYSAASYYFFPRSATGATTISLQKKPVVYPSPANNNLSVLLHGVTPSTGRLTLYNQEGKIVLEQSLENNVSNIDVSGILPGVYIYHINTNGHSYTGNCIKE